MKHYAVEYMSGRNTTTGQPNKTTGYHNIACYIGVFSKKSDRDGWVEDGEITSDMQGNCREIINYSNVRGLCRGETIEQMNENLELCLDVMVVDI